MATAKPASVRTRPSPSPLRRLRRFLALVLMALLLAVGLTWWAGPALLAPVEPFVQGPGGAVAYVSLAQQIREQSAQFWAGGDVQIRLSEQEFSGMLSSALLTGKGPEYPIQKVRGSLVGGEIKVEMVITLPYERVPRRFRGPLGIRLRLAPVVSESGLVQFRITRAFAGRVPISPALIRKIGESYPVSAGGLNAREASISLPLADMVSQSLGRKVEIKRFTADGGELSLIVAMPSQQQ